MPSPRTPLATLVFLLTGLFATAAMAHGAEPLPENLYGFESGDWVFHTNFGIFTSDHQTEYVCEEAFSGGDDFRVAALGLTRWVIFTDDAIYRTDDGCDFERVATLPKIPADVAAMSGGDAVAYVVNTDSSEDAGLHVSDDAGASFQKVDIDVSARQFTRVEFLEGGDVLVSSYARDAESQGAAELMRVSLTDVTVTPLDVPDRLKYPYLLDVESQALVWQATTDDGQSLFWGTVEDPARDSFPLESWPNGVVLSAGGAEFWIAAANSGGKGLTHATGGDMMVDVDPEHSGICVGRAGATVYACGRGDREGHELSRVVDSQIEAALRFDDITGPRSDCPSDSDVATTCPAVWPELARGLGVDIDEDGDEGDAGDGGDDAGGDGHDPDDRGGVCASVGGDGPVGVHVVLACLFGVWVWRVRRDQGSALNS